MTLKALSFKTKKLLNNLGGIEKAINYLEKNGDFTKIPGFGRASDYQLKEYLQQLAKYGMEPVCPILLKENDPINAEIILHYESLKDQYTVRTINILRFMEYSVRYEENLSNKVLFINTYFFQPFDFLSIRNAGKKTVLELYKLAKDMKAYFMQKKPENSSVERNGNENAKNQKSEQGLTFELDKIGFHLLQEYEILKIKSSVRTINILKLIENKENFDHSTKNQFSFLEKYFLSNFDYYSFENAGLKTVQDLRAIRSSLVQLLEKIHADRINIDKTNDNPITNYLNYYFTNVDLTQLKIGTKYSLQRVFRVLIGQTKLSAKVKLVLNEILEAEKEISFKDISNKASCTIETVRTTLKRITESIIPKIIDALNPFRADFKIENGELDSSSNIWEIRHFENFFFESKPFKTNSKITECLYLNYFQQEFVYINNITPLVNGKSPVFDCKNNFYFISKKFASETHFLKLILFLDEEIYAFESLMFEYNLQVLIFRFYQENSLSFEKKSLELLFNIISKIKREEVEIDSNKLRKIIRNQNNENIKKIIEDFLRTTNQAKKTNEIINELRLNHVEIDNVQLLPLLNKWSQTFSRIGNGAWGLTDWLTSKTIKGSIREIVEKLLSESERPLHISEFLSYFESFRPISESSLISNIKISENIKFQFFNCSFIGLKNKEYDEYWHQIPRFAGVIIKNVVNNDFSTFQQKIEILESKGYPKLHCIYIINKNSKK